MINDYTFYPQDFVKTGSDKAATRPLPTRKPFYFQVK